MAPYSRAISRVGAGQTGAVWPSDDPVSFRVWCGAAAAVARGLRFSAVVCVWSGCLSVYLAISLSLSYIYLSNSLYLLDREIRERDGEKRMDG